MVPACQDPLVQLGHLVHKVYLDHQELLDHAENQDYQDSPAPTVYQDTPEIRDRSELKETPALLGRRVQSVSPVSEDLKVIKVLVVQSERKVTREIRGLMEKRETSVRRVNEVLRVFKELPASKVQRVRKVSRDLEVKPVLLAPLERKASSVYLASQATQGHLVKRATKEPRDVLELLEIKEIEETLEHREKEVNKALEVSADPEVAQANKELLDRRVILVNQDHPELREKEVFQGLKELEDIQDCKVYLDKMGKTVSQDLQEREGHRDNQELTVRQARQEYLEPLDPLEKWVPLVNRVKQVHKVFQVNLDYRVKLEKRDLLVHQDPKENLDKLAPQVYQVSLEREDFLVYRECQA